MSATLSRELKDVREDLQARTSSRKIRGIQQVIIFMNMGKNVSSLFFDVMKCLEIQNAEIKKLVYLYITQYAQEHPQEAMMSVNSFVKDAKDRNNSLVRAMAIRTMGCLRVQDLNEYLLAPVIDALSDKDTYVKKIAVMTVPKIFDLSPDIILKNGVIEKMAEILKTDDNAYVIANTILALHEIERGRFADKGGKDAGVQRRADQQSAGRASRVHRCANKSGAKSCCWTFCPSRTPRTPPCSRRSSIDFSLVFRTLILPLFWALVNAF